MTEVCDDPVWNLEGVIADIEAGQVNRVDAETCQRVQRQIDSLRDENNRLRAALKPFAFLISQRVGDNHLPDDHVIDAKIKMSEIRKVRAALEGDDESTAI